MYHLEIMPKAETDLARLDATIEQRVLDKLRALYENCDTHRHEALRGPHRGKFRRHTRKIVVHEVGHRSSVY